MATTTTTVPRPHLKLYDLDVTVVSAKHLKNVNWKNGDLKPYVILWVDPDRRQATKPDDSGSTRPVWNERFVFPLAPRDSSSATLTLEVFHSKPSEAPKPLVGTLRFEIRDLMSNHDEYSGRVKSFELKRPSGRPHGKIRLKLSLIERPMENYQPAPAPPPSYYYSSAPAPAAAPPQHGYRGYSPYSAPPPPLSPPPQPYSYGGYSDPHSGYYSSYYQPPPPPPRPFFERESSYGAPGPSAPLDYSPYDYHKRSSGKSGAGLATGAGAGAVAGALGGLALDEGLNKYEEDKVADRVENDVVSTSRDDRYGDYRSVY